MRMYGLSVDQQFVILGRLSCDLEKLVREVEDHPSASLLMEAELTAASAYDHLRDMTIWLRGTREAIDRNTAREGVRKKLASESSVRVAAPPVPAA